MTFPFEFATASRIVFGRGEFRRLGALAREFGHRALIVCGGEHLARSGVLAEAYSLLQGQGLVVEEHRVVGEPRLDVIEGAIAHARSLNCDLLIGMGGGSAIDAAKAVAGLAPQNTAILDHLEVIGQGLPLGRPALPVIAVPTTAGTGAEVTKNAVIGSTAHACKASLRSAGLFPRVALVDPALTDGLPPEITASTGLDALTQLIEPFVSHRANPVTDALARQGLIAALRSLERAVLAPDTGCRDDMALASLCGGLALANAGLGAVHGFAAPLGAALSAPHGLVCAALLPHVVRTNLDALRSRASDSASLGRYAELGRLFSGQHELNDSAAQNALVDQLFRWVKRLASPSLSAYGLTRELVPILSARAKLASSMKGNPVALTDAELEGCLIPLL